ncbi:unnamed protein product, partial [Brenthis ino]
MEKNSNENVIMDFRIPSTNVEDLGVDEFQYQEENINTMSVGIMEENLRAEKRTRPEDEGEWTVVGKEKKAKPVYNKIEIYITSTEILPKQFAMAKLLKNNDIMDIDRLKYINPYKIRLDMNNEMCADKLENCEEFLRKGWRIYRAMEKDISYGLIRDVDLELSNDEILSRITCPNRVEIISVSRLKRRCTTDGSGWTPSGCVRISFRGAYLPSYVSVDGLKINVDRRALTMYVPPESPCIQIDTPFSNSLENITSKNLSNHETRASTKEVSYAEIMKPKVGRLTQDNVDRSQGTSASVLKPPKEKHKRRKQDREDISIAEEDTVDSDDEKVSEKEEKIMAFSDLVNKLKDIVFLRGISVQTKAYNIVKCCLEWAALLLIDLLPNWTLIKKIIDFVLNNNGSGT